MPSLLLDGIEKLTVDPTKHANEVNTLAMLTQGLANLAVLV
jgi:hypothetical protein